MDNQVRTLVVDDEKGVRFFLEETLRREGYDVTSASSGEDALDRLRDTPFDLVMLDLRLGGRTDGLRVLEAIRWRWPETVVIILTGHGSMESALTAIREGVDGYLLKPVEPQEVRHTVAEALERRRQRARVHQTQEDKQVLEVGPFRVDTEKHLVTMDGQPLDLTPQEWSLLVHLIENRQKVLTPEELVRVVREYEPEDLYEARQIIKWYVHRLRRKVEPKPSKPRYILNVRGVGYTFGG
ncbi:MAG: response regulator transcription factor [Chloroflexi bacterium]|nr:response regulator transcription factor [Chloroflexota bacterium]